VKLRKRQRPLLVVAILIFGLGIVGSVHHFRTKRALADYQKQLIAAGEKLTVDEVMPKPVPLEQNGANTFFRAFTLMNVAQSVFTTNPPSSMTMVAAGKARVGWAEPQIRSEKATNSWDDAIANVNELAPALASLEKLIERPMLDFNLNYRMGFAIPLPHLAQSKQAAQKLCYAALCDLHQGDVDSATRRLRTVLAISHGGTDEQFIISQLVRIAITAIGSASTWELLQSPHVSDEQLAQLQRDWSRLEFAVAAENAVAMERAIGQMTVAQMRESSAEFRKIASGFAWPPVAAPNTGGDWFDQAQQFAEGTWDKTRLKARETAWRFSWSYTDQLRTMKGLQVVIDCARQFQTNGNLGAALSWQQQQWESLGFQSLDTEEDFDINKGEVNLRTLFSQSILALSKFLNRVMVIEANRQLVVTAIALQRYKLRHGGYPADLNALVPDFLPAVPQDPLDGQPLRYKPNQDGTFLLYSIGEDGIDNGGDPNPVKIGGKSFYWRNCRDWVWPQPATPLEVEEFYQREFK